MHKENTENCLYHNFVNYYIKFKNLKIVLLSIDWFDLPQEKDGHIVAKAVLKVEF